MAVPRLRVPSVPQSRVAGDGVSDEVELYHRTYTRRCCARRGRRGCGCWSPRTARCAPACTCWPASRPPTWGPSSTPRAGSPHRSTPPTSSSWARTPWSSPATASARWTTGSPRRPRRAGDTGTRGPTACSRCCWPRPLTSTTSSRRLSPSNSSGTSCTRWCSPSSCRPARPSIPPGARRPSAGPRTTGAAWPPHGRTTYTQARTLGARGLSYHGMDSTYASSLAILRRIFTLEGAPAPSRGD
jgi:hypothetical protein